MEIRTLAQNKQDVEHKRKKVEGQLADLQSRFNDSERQKAELGDRVSKITVSDGGGCIDMLLLGEPTTFLLDYKFLILEQTQCV